MPKRATAFDLVLRPRRSKTPAYRWLYSSLRTEILEGRLSPGARLPATRDLARQYRLSRGTIVTAFELLKSEGYLQGTLGSGTYVSKLLPESFLEVQRKPHPAAAQPKKKPAILSRYAKRVKLFQGFELRPTRAFRSNVPALDLFPTNLWAQIAARRFRRASSYFLLGSGPLGHQPLREAVANYLNASRGANCTADQIAIVSGVQEAIDLTARLLLNPGDQVCMENPGYVGARMVFEAAGAKVKSVQLDEEGIKLNPQTLRNARLIYVTPGHQFPAGIAMSLARRLELLECARKSHTLIFEDDYDSEFRYSGPPIPALQGFDRHNQVIFAGSFSKVLFPSLRLGYVVLPAILIDRYEAAISLTTRHAALPDQAVLCDFIVEGHFARHLRRMREIYAHRLQVLQQAAKENLSGLLEIPEIEAGLQTVGWLKKGITAEAATKAAAEKNVEVYPLSRYTKGKAIREGLQLGFAAINPKEIKSGIKALANALVALSP